MNAQSPRRVASKLLSVTANTTKRSSAYLFQKQSNQLRPTAWLDGLRGLASFLVFIFHEVFHWWYWANNETVGLHFNYGDNEHTYDWWRLPFIRLIYAAGGFMVTIFFVISGFVLTQSALKHIHAQDHKALLKNVSSAAIRRVLRIWLPLVVTSLATVVLMRLGVGGSPGLTNIEYRETWGAQLHVWALDMIYHINPYSYKDRMSQTRTDHAKTGWTIPLEIYGSYVCYMLSVAMARVSRAHIRAAIMIVTTAWVAYNGSWFLVLFLCGMMLADYDLVLTKGTGLVRNPESNQSSYTWNITWLTVLGTSLWVAGWSECWEPWSKHDMRGIWTLTSAACGTVVALYHLQETRVFFESPALQFLGRISFGLYLVHVPIMDLFTQPYIRPFYAYWLGPISGYLVFWCTMTTEIVIVLIMGERAERFIDAPSIIVAKQLEALLISNGNREPIETSSATSQTTILELPLDLQESLDLEKAELRDF